MRLWNFLRNISKTKMSTNSRVAVCQMTSIGDKAANLNVVTNLIEDVSKENVQMIFFPEACDYIFDSKKSTLENAEPILGGATVNKYRALAKKYGVWLSMGGLHEKDDKNQGKVYNTHVLIDNAGNIVQTYRKLHLFDVEIPERNVRLKESDFATSGDHIVTPVSTPIGNIGLCICYDVRFPELSTQLAMLGADILTYPSAFTFTTGEAHWEVLLRARAIENQCYVIAAAQFGNHNAKRKSFGRAMIVDPWGQVLSNCDQNSPCYSIANIDVERLKEVRRNMPVFGHRRKSVYSLYSSSLRSDLLPEHNDKVYKRADPPTTYSGPCHVFGHVTIPDTCVFYESRHSYAFVNLRCVIPGHVLVAPTRLAERNEDLTDEEAMDFFKTIRLVQKLMERVHNASSCTVTIQDGPDAGQTVKHVHCHIMPRKKGDFIENDHIYLELAKHDQLKCAPSKPARTLEEMEKEAKLLREELKKLKSVL